MVDPFEVFDDKGEDEKEETVKRAKKEVFQEFSRNFKQMANEEIKLHNSEDFEQINAFLKADSTQDLAFPILPTCLLINSTDELHQYRERLCQCPGTDERALQLPNQDGPMHRQHRRHDLQNPQEVSEVHQRRHQETVLQTPPTPRRTHPPETSPQRRPRRPRRLRKRYEPQHLPCDLRPKARHYPHQQHLGDEENAAE
jgi:hypothetical protein